MADKDNPVDLSRPAYREATSSFDATTPEPSIIQEWHLFIDPESNVVAYVNLATKEFSYSKPPNGNVIVRGPSGQYFELYDELIGSFYYYETLTQKSTWKRPEMGDILPASLVTKIFRKKKCSQAGENRASFLPKIENMKTFLPIPNVKSFDKNFQTAIDSGSPSIDVPMIGSKSLISDRSRASMPSEVASKAGTGMFENASLSRTSICSDLLTTSPIMKGTNTRISRIGSSHNG
jgi:hypothetical protein